MTDSLDLASLRLVPGEGRRLDLDVAIDPLLLGGERYACMPARVPVRLEVSRMVGHGYALHLTFTAALAGSCMRCLHNAAPTFAVDTHEVDRPGGGKSCPAPTFATTSSTSPRGRTTRSRSMLPPRSSAAPTAPGSAPSAPSTSTRPAPHTTTIAHPTRAGRSWGNCTWSRWRSGEARLSGLQAPIAVW